MKRYMDAETAGRLAAGHKVALNNVSVLSREAIELSVQDIEDETLGHMRREMGAAVAEALVIAGTATVEWKEERNIVETAWGVPGHRRLARDIELCVRCYITPLKRTVVET